MYKKNISETLAYLKLFQNIIPHMQVVNCLYDFNIKQKDDILFIKEELDRIEFSSSSEIIIAKAFKDFLNYIIYNNNNKNNHYFMDAILRDLKNKNYWNIYFAGCYEKFKQQHKNDLSKINAYFYNNSILCYIQKYIIPYYDNNWNEVPKTSFISDLTEEMLNTKTIEENFLKLSRDNISVDNLSFTQKKSILRYAALSMIRSPKLLSISFKYFYKYFKKLDKRMCLYDYLCMKFCCHIISYTNFFKYLKQLKKGYEFKIIKSNKNLICSDNQLNVVADYINDKEVYLYFLTLNSNSFIVFYPKEHNIDYNNDSKNTWLKEFYELHNLCEDSESVFIPNHYNINDIRKKLSQYWDVFKIHFFNSINPYHKWKMIDLYMENPQDSDKEINDVVKNPIVCDKVWLNGYFFKNIKEISQNFDKKIICKQTEKKLL